MFFCLCFEKQNINSVLSGGGWISHPPPQACGLNRNNSLSWGHPWPRTPHISYTTSPELELGSLLMDESLWRTRKQFLHLGASGWFFVCGFFNSIFWHLNLAIVWGAGCRSQLIRLEAALLGIFPKCCFCGAFSPVKTPTSLPCSLPTLDHQP